MAGTISWINVMRRIPSGSVRGAPITDADPTRKDHRLRHEAVEQREPQLHYAEMLVELTLERNANGRDWGGVR
jgi:hypothetical protein